MYAPKSFPLSSLFTCIFARLVILLDFNLEWFQFGETALAIAIEENKTDVAALFQEYWYTDALDMEVEGRALNSIIFSRTTQPKFDGQLKGK